MLPTFIRLVLELSDEITTTKAIPSIKNNIFLYFPFKTFFSSATTIGIANIINPKIVGNALQLSPILVIFSVTLFGAYFGVLGMFLAVPIIAVIKLITNDFIDYRTKKKKQEEKL